MCSTCELQFCYDCGRSAVQAPLETPDPKSPNTLMEPADACLENKRAH